MSNNPKKLLVSQLIKKETRLSVAGCALMTAEGRRMFTFEDVRETYPYVGTRLAAVENRWVTWRLFGTLPVWRSWPKQIELNLTEVIAVGTLYGVGNFAGLDDMFQDPLCKLGHDWLGTGETPGICQGMNLNGDGLSDRLDGVIV